jgi:hypothetical protein
VGDVQPQQIGQMCAHPSPEQRPASR